MSRMLRFMTVRWRNPRSHRAGGQPAVWLAGATVAVVAAMAGAPPAHASGEAEVRSWIRQIDQMPTWRTSYDDMTWNGDEVRLSGLKIRAVPSGPVFTFETIEFSDPKHGPDGGLSVDAVAIDSVVVDTDGLRLGLTNLDLDEFALPSLAGFTWDDGKPNASVARSYGFLADMSLGRGTIESLVFIEHGEGIESRISYDTIAMNDWSDGAISTISVGEMWMESPSPDPIVNMSAARFEGRGINLKAFRDVFDPDRYVDGKGDGLWRTAVERAVYDNVRLAAPDGTLTIGQVAMGSLRVRQPPRSFVEFLDVAAFDSATMADNEEIAGRAYDVVSAFGLGSFVADGIAVEAGGIDRFTLDRFSLQDLSADYLGELAIDGLNGSIIGEGLISIGRLAIGGLDLPDSRHIRDAIKADSASRPVDMASLYPKLGFLELLEIDAESREMPRMRVTKLRLDLADYLGRVPSRIELELSGARWATSMIPDRRARDLLMSLGYNRLDLDLSFSAAWSQAEETVRVDDFAIAVRDAGSAEGRALFTGLSREAIEAFQVTPATPADLQFASGSMTFQDSSIVARGLAHQATRMKVDPALFREQFAGALPFMISFIGDPDFQRKIAPVLQTFIRTPGEITITAEPASPVGVPMLLSMIRSAPHRLPELLSLTVSGTAGQAPGDGGEPTGNPAPAE